MSGQSHPPRIALWILRRLDRTGNTEAVTGDLFEPFRERQSAGWFWWQTLVAVLISASRFLRLRRIDIWFAAAGTGVLWCIPWAKIFPLDAMAGSMSWSERLGWVIGIEATTALILLPVYAVRFLLLDALRWTSLRDFFRTSFLLFAVGDAAILGWDLNRPHTAAVHSTWLVGIQLMWIYATLLVSGPPPRKPAIEQPRKP